MFKNRITLTFAGLLFLCIILKNNAIIFEWFFPIKIVEKYGHNVNKIIYKVINYSQIDNENKSVLEENRSLREDLINLNEKISSNIPKQKAVNLFLSSSESNKEIGIDPEKKTKSLKQDTFKNFELISAKVVYNSIIKLNNYIILDKGSKDGIKPYMAIVSHKGIVGKVKYVSKNFCSVISVLNTHMRTSIQLVNVLPVSESISEREMLKTPTFIDNRSRNVFATLSWDGKNYKKAILLYVPQHVNIKKGQHVVTSGYNAIFPPNILVGKVSSFTKKHNKMFYNAYIDLENDFSSLGNVFVIINNKKIEQHTLLKKTIKFYDK